MRTVTRDLVRLTELGLLTAVGKTRARHYLAGPTLREVSAQVRLGRQPLVDRFPRRMSCSASRAIGCDDGLRPSCARARTSSWPIRPPDKRFRRVNSKVAGWVRGGSTDASWHHGRMRAAEGRRLTPSRSACLSSSVAWRTCERSLAPPRSPERQRPRGRCATEASGACALSTTVFYLDQSEVVR